MMTPRLFSEKLYLSKEGGDDVFIPEQFARHVRPFQRDGIRFLYRLFAKKKPGAILNDPAGYGKIVQVVLFVNALRSSLQPLPSLILCSPIDVPYWKYHFHMWTDSAKDVLEESENVFSKKEVLVSSIHNLAEMTRREWGIVVVDSVNVEAYLKQLNKLTAKFKIWLSSDNLVDNLSTLSSVSEWIQPGDKLEVKLYDKVGLPKRAQIEKDFALDIYCQDIVLRRTNEDVPLANEKENKRLYDLWKVNKTVDRVSYFKIYIEGGTPAPNIEPTTPHNPPNAVSVQVSTVTVKNKDATGLKIKRSKKAPSTGESSRNARPDEETQVVKKPRLSKFGLMQLADITSESLIRNVNVESPEYLSKRDSKDAKVDKESFTEPVAVVSKGDDSPKRKVDQDKTMIEEMPTKEFVQDQVISKDERFDGNARVDNVCESITASNDNLDLTAHNKSKGETTLDNILFPFSKSNASPNRNENSNHTSVNETSDGEITLDKIVFADSKSSHSIIKTDDRIKAESQKTQASEYQASDIHSSVRRIEESAKKLFKGSVLDSLF